ncbi:baseplate J/gp47 family protein [Pseudomonas guariconensis]|uniref:baseplate J/gp47 family protein n=1 Tax=Pseudomonas guariconensis TaxID=1288410 RepID=UPI0018D9533A|nr:baseplate J/gp47 family protein [Pseudomonas guariconensis]MBH3360770.1 baseplate J/gp47 family protein [Pseudomonas guariconensis]
MASSTAPVITATGISAPTYAEVLAFLQDQYRSIYGADVYLGSDSQDGQFLGVIALAISDANAATIAAYLSFSPGTGQGAGLSSNVKINGIKRMTASSSQADVVVIGQAGTTIINGVAEDEDGNKWALPASVIIPASGEITVTAKCSVVGAITASPGQINKIATPTRGWQSVSNPNAASPGAPVETDAALRKRQKTSTALPSLTVLEGTIGAVANVPGVTRYAAVDNDTGVTDSNGIPEHSLAIIAEGGDATAIAQAIAAKKGPGGGTYGTTSVTVLNVYDMPITISFFRPAYQAMTVAIALKALPGYTSAIGVSVQEAVSDYINKVPIGGGPSQSVEWADALTAANSVPGSATFKLTSLIITGPGGAGTPDVPLAFNQASTCTPADVALTVT